MRKETTLSLFLKRASTRSSSEFHSSELSLSLSLTPKEEKHDAPRRRGVPLDGHDEEAAVERVDDAIGVDHHRGTISFFSNLSPRAPSGVQRRRFFFVVVRDSHGDSTELR